MHVMTEGQGPVVVLSHALALDSDMWADVAARLSRKYTVVRYDHRGHGSSPDARASLPFSMDDLADDAAEVIRQQSSSQAVFVGLSLGGMVAQALAARWPSLLSGVAILNATAHYPDRTIWDTRIRAVQAAGMPSIADASIERWLTPAFRHSPAGATAEDALRGRLLNMDPGAYVQTCRAIAAMDMRASNRTLSLPALVVAGRHDTATPPSMSHALAGDIAGAQVVEVDGAHLSAVECPEQVADVLEAWLARSAGLPPV